MTTARLPKTADDFHKLQTYFENAESSELRNNLVRYVISAQLNTRQQKITGKVIGTHFTVGGVKSLKVKVQDKHTTDGISSGTYLVSFDSVTDIHNNPHN